MHSQSQREDLERVKRDLNEANARAEELSRSKTNELGSLMSRFNKEKQELEDSLRVLIIIIINFLEIFF